MSTIKVEVQEAVEKFLEAWKAGDAAGMLAASQLTWQITSTDRKGRLQAMIDATKVEEYIVHNVITRSKIMAECFVSINGQPQEKVVLVKEIAPYQPSEDGSWGVNPTTALRLVAE